MSSDACILCDHNVPRNAPHFVVTRVEAEHGTTVGSRLLHPRHEGVVCGDERACATRALERARDCAVTRNEWQQAMLEWGVAE